MSKKINVFNQAMASDVPVSGLKCLKLTCVCTFAVNIEIPEPISSAIEKGDSTARAMNKAVKEDYKKFLNSAHQLQRNGDKTLIQRPDQSERDKLVKQITELLRVYQGACEEAAHRSIKTVWDGYADKKPEYKSHPIHIVASISGSVTVKANNVGLIAKAPGG
jgi:hypothetical protein